VARGILGLVVSVLLALTPSLSPPAFADDDPTNDAHDPYFNEDEYQAFYTPPIRCRPVRRAT